MTECRPLLRQGGVRFTMVSQYTIRVARPHDRDEVAPRIEVSPSSGWVPVHEQIRPGVVRVVDERPRRFI